MTASKKDAKRLYISIAGGKQWGMRNRNWIVAAAWLLIVCTLHADSGGSKSRYHVDVLRATGRIGGLPENTVIALTQTRDGFLWVGTQDGLARFDGVQFDVFDEANTPGLHSVVISCLFEDGESNLWIGTAMGDVALVKNGLVQSFPLGRGSREGKLSAACEDANGTVWLYTADGRLARRRKGSKNIDVWRDVPSSYYRARRLSTR